METSRNITSKARGRPRSASTRQVILASALHEFQTHGFQNTSLEGIAKAAGVGKPTLYRWWSSKAALVLEALTEHTGTVIPVPNLGDVEKDLKQYLQDTCDTLNQPTGRMIRELIGASQLDEVFAKQFWNDFLLTRRQGILEILVRSQQKNEVSFGIDLELIADLCYGPIWYRLLNRHNELDRNFVEELVTAVVQYMRVKK